MTEHAEEVLDPSGELIRLLKLEDRRDFAVTRIATWVALGIVHGRLVPGQDLNSVDLARRFDSSRTPVREALMLLESEGLVESQARRRPRVASFTPEHVQRIYFVRGHLLSIVGALVAQNASDDDLAELANRLEEMQRDAAADDVDGYFWGHVALQARMVDISGNHVLTEILDSLALRTLVLRYAALARDGRLAKSVAAQVKIMDAIQERDGELAALLLSRATEAAFRAIDLSTLTAGDDAGRVDPSNRALPG